MPATQKRSSKRAVPAPAKPSVKTSSRSTKPFLRFYHSESLRKKTLAMLTTLERSNDGKQHRDALANIVVELTDAGMDYYFLRPLKLANAGFFVEKSASVGMAATTRILGSVIRSIVGGMDDPQLLSVCSYIRQLMK
jgi:hypothetical protein